MFAEILPLALKYWKPAVIVIGGLAICYTTITYLERRGAQKVLTNIENQDRSAADAAVQARSKRSECTGPGSDPRNRWDQSSGLCIRP